MKGAYITQEGERRVEEVARQPNINFLFVCFFGMFNFVRMHIHKSEEPKQRQQFVTENRERQGQREEECRRERKRDNKS